MECAAYQPVLPKVSVLGDRISIRVWFQVLIASEAYLSTEVWRGAHFPPPLEQPLVGREPEYLKPKNIVSDLWGVWRYAEVWFMVDLWLCIGNG